MLLKEYSYKSLSEKVAILRRIRYFYFGGYANFPKKVFIMDSKFEKFIRLTESSNDHEALSALRYAQNLCIKNGVNFSDFIINSKDSRDNNKEAQFLKRQILSLSYELEKLEDKIEFITLENQKLKKRIQNAKGAKNLKEKYKKLKEDLEFIEEENELITKVSEMYEEVYDCEPSEKDKILNNLVRNFIVNKSIKLSESEWKSTNELYENFLDSCHDVRVMSVKKFSQILSTILRIKSVKGGKRKDLMGFKVEFKPYGYF